MLCSLKHFPAYHFYNFPVYSIYSFSSLWCHFWSFLQFIISIYKGLMLENMHDYWIMQTENQVVHTIKILT